MVVAVLLDSNFLYVPVQFKVDIYDEIPRFVEEKTELIVLTGVRDELASKVKRESTRQSARDGMLALQILAKKVDEQKARLVKIDPHAGEAIDDYVVRAAIKARNDAIVLLGTNIYATRIYVATNDKQLKRKLDAEGIGVLHLRQRKFFAFA